MYGLATPFAFTRFGWEQVPEPGVALSNGSHKQPHLSRRLWKDSRPIIPLRQVLTQLPYLLIVEANGHSIPRLDSDHVKRQCLIYSQCPEQLKDLNFVIDI